MRSDANVLINERVREEAARRRDPQAAIHAGLQSARSDDSRLQRDDADRRAGAAHLRVGAGARVQRGALLGIMTSIFSSVGGQPRAGDLWYGYAPPARRPSRSATHRGSEGLGRHGVLQDPSRHTVHAVCAVLQHHLLVTFLAAVFFLATKGLHFLDRFTAAR